MPRLWPNSTVVCVASGPSLTQADVEFIRGKARVIAINTSYKLALWADALYACDQAWWKWNKGAPDFPGLKYSLQALSGRWPGVTVLENTGTEGLELKPHGLRTGRNSGYQALGLAFHFGASRIVLLGYDCQRGPKGEQHWHQDHPNKTRSPYSSFRQSFQTIVEPLRKHGVTVLNCSRDTSLECFPRMSLEQALPSVREEAVA